MRLRVERMVGYRRALALAGAGDGEGAGGVVAAVPCVMRTNSSSSVCLRGVTSRSTQPWLAAILLSSGANSSTDVVWIRNRVRGPAASDSTCMTCDDALIGLRSILP